MQPTARPRRNRPRRRARHARLGPRTSIVGASVAEAPQRHVFAAPRSTTLPFLGQPVGLARDAYDIFQRLARDRAAAGEMPPASEVFHPLGQELKMTIARTGEWKRSQLRWLVKLGGADSADTLTPDHYANVLAKLAVLRAGRLRIPLSKAVGNLADRLNGTASHASAQSCVARQRWQ